MAGSVWKFKISVITRNTQLSPCLPCPIIQAPALRKECRQLHILVGLVSIETRKLGPGGQCCRINYRSGSQVLKDRWNGPQKSRRDKRIQDFCQHVSSPTFTTVPVLALMLYSPPIPSCDSFSPPDRWIRWRGMACSWLLRSAGDHATISIPWSICLSTLANGFKAEEKQPEWYRLLPLSNLSYFKRMLYILFNDVFVGPNHNGLYRGPIQPM